LIETEIDHMSENKIGDVVVLKTETQQQAFYQLADGTSVFLAAISLDDYENPVLRERFFEFATEIVLARIRASGSNVRHVQRDTVPSPETNPHAGVPCWACTSPIAQEVRTQLRSSAAADIHLSPSGLPVNCCRIETVGAFAGGSAAPPATTRLLRRRAA
jgi:hypothetical protein